jgi:hypothetical protein
MLYDTAMRFCALLLLAASGLAAADTLHVFGKDWRVVNASDWRTSGEHGGQILALVTPREPLPGPRRPIQFAVAETPAYQSARVEVDVRPHQRSLMIVFAYRDAAHFDYAHLSTDTASKESHHNGIFHVYGGERVRISNEAGPAAFPETNRWYHVVLEWSGATGEVRVRVEGREIPALHAVDLSLTSGCIGLGSFDETADFRSLKITGTE